MAAFADLTKAIWNPTEPDDQDLAVLGTFDNTISGWAECLEAIYNDIGGCFCNPHFFAFDITFHKFSLSLGHLRHHSKHVDYFKLL